MNKSIVKITELDISVCMCVQVSVCVCVCACVCVFEPQLHADFFDELKF